MNGLKKWAWVIVACASISTSAILTVTYGMVYISRLIGG